MKLDADAIEQKVDIIKHENDIGLGGLSQTYDLPENLNARTGVERVLDIPADCRREDPNYEFNRRKWVRRLKETLAAEDKCLIENVRFLDDGIVYAWAHEDALLMEQCAQTSIVQKDSDRGSLLNDIERSIHELEILEISSDKKEEVEDPFGDSRLNRTYIGSTEIPILVKNDETMSTAPSDSSEEEGRVGLRDLIAEVEARTSARVRDEDSQDNAIRRRLTKLKEDVEESKQPTKEVHPLGSIDWKNYRNVLILKRVPLSVTQDDIYSVFLHAGFPFARIRRVMLHTSNRHHRLASVQFHEEEAARAAHNKLKLSHALFPTWWQNIVLESCEAPRKISGAGTEKSKEIPPANESYRETRSFTGKRRRSSDDETSGEETVPTSRRASQFHPSRRTLSTQARGGSEGTPVRQRDDGIAVTRSSNQSIDAETNEDNSEDTSDSEPSDVVSLEVNNPTYSHSTGTVSSFEVSNGSRKLNETACCPMPKVQYGRPRRLAVPQNGNRPMVAATIRGDLQFIDLDTRSRISRMSMPAEQPSLLCVSDACFAGDSVIVVYRQASPQVSMIKFDHPGKARKFELRHAPHGSGGVNCLTSMHDNNESTTFFTGGYDKQICLWTYNHDNHEYPDMVERLPYEHNTSVFAMAWRSHSDSLISASGQKVWTYNAKKGLLGKAAEISNKVCQVHVHPQNPQIAILEVDHIDRQILVYDTRRAGFNQKPTFELGLREEDRTYLSKSKHRKGDAYMSYFVRGYQNGIVAMWDYRNPRSPVLASNKCRGPVWHTTFSRTGTPSIWAYSEGACVNFTLS